MSEHVAAGWIECGSDHPDPEIAADLRTMRANEGYPTEGGCGRRMRWVSAYRCVECGRWFHRDCIREHFAATRDDARAALGEATGPGGAPGEGADRV